MSIKRCFQKNMPAAKVVAGKENYTRKRSKIIEAAEKHTNFWVRGRKKYQLKMAHTPLHKRKKRKKLKCCYSVII